MTPREVIEQLTDLFEENNLRISLGSNDPGLERWGKIRTAIRLSIEMWKDRLDAKRKEPLITGERSGGHDP